MNKKISQFELVEELQGNDLLTVVQNSSNKNITVDGLNTSLSDTFATNERVDSVEADVALLDSKVDSNYVILDTKIVDGDTKVTTNLNSTITSYYDVLNGKIITLETKHDTEITEVNGTVQEWIDDIDNRSTLEQLKNAEDRLTVTENLVTALAELIASGGGGGVAPGFHTQPTSTIFPLSGYYYAGVAEDLSTTDTLNQALSKLEGKIKHVESSIGGDTKYVITSGDNTQPTDGNLYSAKRSDLNYISKKTDDVANGYIKFLKGIQGSQTFRTGFTGEGAALYPEGKRWKLEVDDLFVRGAATFNELIVNEIKATGGDILVSIADIEILEVTITPTNDYKCTFDTQDGTKRNAFVVGDQALCQIFDGKNVKRYWRMVSEVGSDYIVLSQSVCESGSSIPEPGDKVIQLGNRYPDNEDRKSAIMISARGVDGPSITMYQNIDDFNLVNKDYTVIGKHSKFVGTLMQVSSNGDIIRVPLERGLFVAGTTYYYYDRVSYNGSLWLCMASSTTSIPSKDNEEWLLQVEKGEQGTSGADKAKWVEITGGRLFMYDNPTFTGTPNPAKITLFCNTYNIENPTFEWVNKNTNDIIGNMQAIDVTPEMFKDLRNMMVRCTVTSGAEIFYDETQMSKLGNGAEGEDAYYIDLSNSNMTVPYDAAGVNPLVPINSIYTYVYVYKGINQIAVDSMSAEVIEGTATVLVGNDKVTLQTFSSSSARVKITVVADGQTLTKDLWITKVNNGEDGFDGVDAAYVMLTGEQTFKYDNAGAVSPTQITLYASTYNIVNPVYKWEWSVAGMYVWTELVNETSASLTVSHNGAYFGVSNNEVTFKVTVTSGNGGGVSYMDMMTINKLYDGKDGESPYRGTLSNEAHTVAASFDGTVSVAEMAKAITYYDLYQGTRKLGTSEYSITRTNVDDNTQNQLSEDTTLKKLTLASIGRTFDSTIFKIEFHVPAGSNTVVDVVDFTIAKAKGGAPGDYEIPAYCRSNESQPSRPTMTSRPISAGTYSGGNYWYPDAPSAGSYAVWKSSALFDGMTGLLKSGEQWTLPTKISGKDGYNGSDGSQGPQGPQGPAGPMGPQGMSGAGLNYRGEYDSSKYYYYDNNIRDVVRRNGTFYCVANKGTVTPNWSAGEWSAMTSFEMVATKLLFAEDATIANWVFNNSMIRSMSNSICLKGSETGTDVFLAAGDGSTTNAGYYGNDINTYASLKLHRAGILTVGGGTSTSNAGISGTGSSSSDIRFWAGNTYASRASSPFRVYQDGSVVANNCTLTGAFQTTTSGYRISINTDKIKLTYNNLENVSISSTSFMDGSTIKPGIAITNGFRGDPSGNGTMMMMSDTYIGTPLKTKTTVDTQPEYRVQCNPGAGVVWIRGHLPSPTSPGLSVGDWYNDNGTVKIKLF